MDITGQNKNTMNPTQDDPLAHASATPDVSAIIEAFESAQRAGPCRPGILALAEDTRFNRWSGKSSPPDGKRWQKNLPAGELVKPYDGKPDTEIQLTDELIEQEVDLDITAHAMANLGATTTNITPLTAQAEEELVKVARWVQRAIADELPMTEELLAQIKALRGWAVLNPGWREDWQLIEREIDGETIKGQVAVTQGPEAAAALSVILLDPSLEETAADVIASLYPHLSDAKARKAARELRETGSAKFLDKQLSGKGPCIRALIPGYNYFALGTGGGIEDARGHLVIERMHQSKLESVGAVNEWNEEFIEMAITTQGQYSSYGEVMRDKSYAQDAAGDTSMEIWTAHLQQFDPETGATGWYCTTLSPHLKLGMGETNKERYYAKHYLLSYGHGKAPFIQARRDVTGPALDDARGVPDVTRGNQETMKMLQDALVARAHLEVDPPRAFIGFGGSKTEGWNVPGAGLRLEYGADVKDLSPTRGNPEVAEQAISRLVKDTYRQFALPSAETHPALWQPRQMRRAKSALAPWREAYWQMVVLAYQELDATELALIIGHWPQNKLEDILRHRITLRFDARALDHDWTADTLEFFIKMLGIDNSGLMDRGPIIAAGLNMKDPTLAQAVLRSPAGAQAALYRQVSQDIAEIMLGNPPQLRENDASAGMQLQMAFAVIGRNPRYQQVIQQDPQIKENLNTYVENLQHNEQETSISPIQGRTGVQAMPQGPIQNGPRPMGNMMPGGMGGGQ